MLITGYFLCSTNIRTCRKPLELLIQVIVYQLLLYLILSSFGVLNFSYARLIRKFIPAQWFITLYVVLYAISPYINIIVNRLSNKDWKVFFIIWLSLFSIIPMILGIMDSRNIPIGDINPNGMMKNTAGYSIINFITLYSIGAFIRVNNIAERVSRKYALLTAIFCVLLLWGLRFIPINSSPWHIAGWYDNIIMILLASSLFVLFKNLHFKSKGVNNIAKASLTVFIIHNSLFRFVDTSATLRLPIVLTLLHIMAFVMFVFLVAFILNVIYTFISKRYMNFLDKYSINYFDN